MKTDSSHSKPPSAFPSSARISEPARTLLVVDDDRVVLEAEARLLCQQGYTRGTTPLHRAFCMIC